MAALGYFPKLKRGLGLAFGAYFCMSFLYKCSYLILYQLTKFQCHIFVRSEYTKQNVLLSSYLDN